MKCRLLGSLVVILSVVVVFLLIAGPHSSSQPALSSQNGTDNVCRTEEVNQTETKTEIESSEPETAVSDQDTIESNVSEESVPSERALENSEPEMVSNNSSPGVYAPRPRLVVIVNPEEGPSLGIGYGPLIFPIGGG